MAKSSQDPVVINKVLLECSHFCSIKSCLWLLFCEVVAMETIWPTKIEAFAFWFFMEMACSHLF